MLRLRTTIDGSLVLILLAVVALTQTFRGGIAGSVTDQTGAAIANATVQLVNEGTGTARETTTTGAGEFSFADLPVGLYKVTVTKQGFQTRKFEKVEVAVGKVTNLPITLAIGQTSEVVEVQAAAATLETTSTTLNA